MYVEETKKQKKMQPVEQVPPNDINAEEIYEELNTDVLDKLDGIISLVGPDGRYMTTPPVTNGGHLMCYHGYHWLGGKTNQANLDQLARCRCCVRHQLYKPIIYRPWNSNMGREDRHLGPWQGGGDQDNNDCRCECRHIARMICRMCDE